jgi:two-component system nitrogen regulation response regulator GlnG
MIAENCAATSETLLESELFGYVKGAFTGAQSDRKGLFEMANKGTLFLDEIGDMPTDLQAKILRVLQDHEVTPVGGQSAERVDVRVLAATHRDLDGLVAAGTFREDLLYRLRVMPLRLPALRERRADIPVLAEYFTARYAEELVGAPRYLASSTLALLSQFDWPGNVRELENAIKRALVLSTGEVLAPEDFAFLEREPGGIEGLQHLARVVESEVARALEASETGEVYRAIIERVERPLLTSVLAHTQGNQIRAAALLGINRNTLRKKIAELDISLPGRS